MSKLICLIGMDGSGKTTHAYRLIAHLQESGVKCKYVWFGTAYFLSYPFMIICHVLGLTKTHALANGQTASEHQYYKNKLVSKVWPWIQFIDLSLLLNLRVTLPLRRGYTVVCDRFVPDIMVELMTDLNDSKLYKKLTGRLILRLIPQHSLLILLNVNESVAWQRKDDIPELKYLILRKKAYKVISDYLKTSIVNAEGPITSVQERLIPIVDNWKNAT
jgi:thymidylate kinase